MILQGDCRFVMQTLPAGFYHTSVTSPPYWGLRDYGIPPSEWPEVTYIPMPGLPPITVPAWTGCLGLEPTPEMFVAHIVLVFREVWRVLREDGTLWLNFGDSYAGAGPRRDEGFNQRYHGKHYLSNKQRDVDGFRPGRDMPTGLKPKDLIGIPWRVAFALQADGWYLRMDNIWAKPNPMPESVKDRTTKAHEYLFLLAKSERYYYDTEAIKETGVQDEWLKGFRGAYIEGETFDNQKWWQRKNKGNFKVPSGWDTDPGSHGTIHRTGRNRSNSFAREVKEGPPPGQQPQHRPDREDIDYSGMRNKRSVWTVATQPFPEAHFATFPEKLIEPCILAGTSRQACPHCGAPWKRKTEQFGSRWEERKKNGEPLRHGLSGAAAHSSSAVGGSVIVTTGWEPTCECKDNDGSGKCHVLDPFGGSGTTRKVALENGRESTIIEIGSQYIEIAERRTATVQPKMQLF